MSKVPDLVGDPLGGVDVSDVDLVSERVEGVSVCDVIERHLLTLQLATVDEVRLELGGFTRRSAGKFFVEQFLSPGVYSVEELQARWAETGGKGDLVRKALGSLNQYNPIDLKSGPKGLRVHANMASTHLGLVNPGAFERVRMGSGGEKVVANHVILARALEGLPNSKGRQVFDLLLYRFFGVKVDQINEVLDFDEGYLMRCLPDLNNFLEKVGACIVERNGVLCLSGVDGRLVVLDEPWVRKRFAANEARLRSYDGRGSSNVEGQRAAVDHKTEAAGFLDRIGSESFNTRSDLNLLVSSFLRALQVDEGVSKRNLEDLRGALMAEGGVDVSNRIRGEALVRVVERFVGLLDKVVGITADKVKAAHLQSLMRGI